MWNNFYSGKHVGTRHLNTFKTITGHRHQLKDTDSIRPQRWTEGSGIGVFSAQAWRSFAAPFRQLVNRLVMAHVRAAEVEMFSLLTSKTTSVGNALERNNWGHYTA